MGFAVVVAAVVVEPRRFGRGNWCLHFPKALVRNESRRTASPKKELGWERGSKSSRKIVEKKKVLRMGFSIVENLSGLQESIFNLSRGPQLHFGEKSKRNCRILLNLSIFPLSPCLGSLGLLSFLTRCLTSQGQTTIEKS